MSQSNSPPFITAKPLYRITPGCEYGGHCEITVFPSLKHLAIEDSQYEMQPCDRKESGFQCGDHFVSLQPQNKLIYEAGEQTCKFQLFRETPSFSPEEKAVDRVLELSKKLEDPYDETKILMEVASARKDPQLFLKAIWKIQKIIPHSEHSFTNLFNHKVSQVLEDIFEQMGKCQLFGPLMEAALIITSPAYSWTSGYKVGALQDIAHQFLKAGLLEQAEQIAELVGPLSLGQKLFLQIQIELKKENPSKDFFLEAIRTSHTVEESHSQRYLVMRQLALALGQLHMFHHAFTLLRDERTTQRQKGMIFMKMYAKFGLEGVWWSKRWKQRER